MDRYEAIIRAMELTDKLLDQDGLSFDLASELLRQRQSLLNSLTGAK